MAPHNVGGGVVINHMHQLLLKKRRSFSIIKTKALYYYFWGTTVTLHSKLLLLLPWKGTPLWFAPWGPLLNMMPYLYLNVGMDLHRSLWEKTETAGDKRENKCRFFLQSNHATNNIQDWQELKMSDDVKYVLLTGITKDRGKLKITL